MNSNTLRYVIAVAEEGNFTRAARRLFISQPSLSQSIQSLERSLGTELFDRSVSPIRLTYAGEEYVKWAKKTLDSEAQTLRRIGDISGGHRRRLVVGVSPYRSLRIMPEVLSRFYEMTGGECTVVLVEQRSSEYMQSMEEGKLDLLIDRPAEPDSPYDSAILGEEQILLAVPDAYRPEVKSGETGVTGELMLGRIRQEDARFLGQLTEEEMRIVTREARAESFRNTPAVILPERQRMGRYWSQLTEQMGGTPPVVLECNSIEMAFLMVRQGLGVTLVPDTLIRFMPPAPHVTYYTLKDIAMSRTMAVLYPHDRYLSKDAKMMIELLQEVLS